MAKKQTKAAISTKAARILASGSVFDQREIIEEIHKLGLYLHVSEKAVNDIMLPELRRILAQYEKDARSLAGSALTQDEIPK